MEWIGQGIIIAVIVLQVTPAVFAFPIWGVVYAWQMLWLAYAWSFMCRPSAQQTIYPAVYVWYSIANCLNIAWIFTWGNLYLTTTFFLIVLLNVSLYSAIGLLFGYFHHIQDQASKCDVWLTRAIVMNGLCFYSAWTTVVICTNLTSVLQYRTSLSAPDSASLTLTLFIGFVLAYFLLENTVLDHYGFRYVLSVYPVALWALSAMLVEHWNEEGAERSAGYTLSLLILTVVLLIVRILLLVANCSYHLSKKPSSTTA